MASLDAFNLIRSTSISTDRDPASVWLYLRFTLSYRDVKELLAERGLDVSYESVVVGC